MAEASAGCPAGTLPTPLPGEGLKITLITLPSGSRLHRVHLNRYGGAQFNPGLQGNARFSPLRDVAGKPVPTLYAGATLACALMETIFHDVPFSPGIRMLDRNRLLDQCHVQLQTRVDLRLVDLSSIALRKLGIRRQQLIDTEKAAYPDTRRWAEAFHRQSPGAQGLSWISRQDDSARAFMLFGDRLPAGSLTAHGDSRPLLDDGDNQDAVLALAERIGVWLVPGH